MVIDNDKYIQRKNCEQLKAKRRRYWRVKEGIDRVSPDHDEWEVYHYYYHSAVEQWTWRIHAVVSSAADDGLQPYQQIWEDEEFGEYEGLEPVFKEEFMGETEQPLPLDMLDDIAATLDKLSIKICDLPEQPPVVDDPWTPDERPSPEEIQSRIEELQDESDFDGDFDE